MTRSHAALITGWLALGPGTLLFSGGAEAIPAITGEKIVATEAGTDPQPAVDQPATAAADALGLMSVSPTRIPCLYAAPEAKYHASDAPPLCRDTVNRQQPLSMQFGRRLAVDSGILGETDGIRVDYRLRSGISLNGVAGYPVRSSKDEFNTEQQVFGLSADTGTFARYWNLNAFAIGEKDATQLEKRSVGGILRYLQPRRSLLVFMDYDTNQDALSAITASGAWKLPNNTTLSATFDVHTSAVHKRQKKSIRYAMNATDGWNWILPEDRIKHHTRKPGEVATRGLSLSHAFSQRLKLSGDFAILDIYRNEESGGGTAATMPSEYFYHLKVTGKDLLIPGNSNKLDIRHRITGSSRISTASIDTRYAINRLWNIIPRLRTEHRNSTNQQANEWVASPAVKMEYRWKKTYGFQVEAGGKWSNQALSSADSSRSSYFMNLGYQAKF